MLLGMLVSLIFLLFQGRQFPLRGKMGVVLLPLVFFLFLRRVPPRLLRACGMVVLVNEAFPFQKKKKKSLHSYPFIIIILIERHKKVEIRTSDLLVKKI